MGMFGVRKPRRFNHQYIYADERKEKLNKMEENAKRELGLLPKKDFSPEDIRGKFIEGTTHLKRRKESERKPLHIGVVLIVIALLLYIWHYLQSGSWAL
ncbi:MAG: rane protein [Bacteroidetes bacterium]|nr:rane protein [Bacteroidota bacterium]